MRPALYLARPDEVVDLARRRQEARVNGDYAASDRLRTQIEAAVPAAQVIYLEPDIYRP